MLPALVTPVDLRLRRTLVRFVILLYKFSQNATDFHRFFSVHFCEICGSQIRCRRNMSHSWETIKHAIEYFKKY